jgi:hypothetical protein
VGCRNLGRLPQLGFLIFFDKMLLVNLINHNLYGIEISAFLIFLIFFGDFFQNFIILEVEIGRNGPGILGVKYCNKLIRFIMNFDKNIYLILYLIMNNF